MKEPHLTMKVCLVKSLEVDDNNNMTGNLSHLKM